MVALQPPHKVKRPGSRQTPDATARDDISKTPGYWALLGVAEWFVVLRKHNENYYRTRCTHLILCPLSSTHRPRRRGALVTYSVDACPNFRTQHDCSAGGNHQHNAKQGRGNTTPNREGARSSINEFARRGKRCLSLQDSTIQALIVSTKPSGGGNHTQTTICLISPQSPVVAHSQPSQSQTSGIPEPLALLRSPCDSTSPRLRRTALESTTR